VTNGEIVTEAVTISYGNFIQAIFNFFVIAFAIFLLVRTINRLREKEAAKPAPPINKQEVLLAEIRDILKNQDDLTSPDKKIV
jgi:large conductance mechanosensitive channel